MLKKISYENVLFLVNPGGILYQNYYFRKSQKTNHFHDRGEMTVDISDDI